MNTFGLMKDRVSKSEAQALVFKAESRECFLEANIDNHHRIQLQSELQQNNICFWSNFFT